MYGRTLDGETLTLAASGWTWQNTFVLWDHETESIWFGGAGQLGWDHLVCVEGPLQDRRLSIIPHQRTFWRTWYRAEPETKIMRRRQP